MGNNPSSFELSKNGLSITGNLWKRAYFVDLKDLRAKHADLWHRTRPCTVSSAKDLQTRKYVQVHLLFEIIRQLVAKNEKELANPILNSTSNWLWKATEVGSGVIETVDEIPQDVGEDDLRDIFALDTSPNGMSQQSWIIDRVMEQGGLWTWSLTNAPYMAEQDTPTEDSPDENSEDPKAHSHFRTLQGAAMIGMASDVIGGQNEETVIDSWRLTHVSRAMATFAILSTACLRPNVYSDYMSRRATFDVDGKLEVSELILTPFEMVMESIPRSSQRSMSVSWLVHPADRAEQRPEEVGV